MTVPIEPGAIAAGADAASKVAGGVQKAVGAIPGVDQLGDITDTIRAVRAWISNRHNWVRTAWFLSGAALFTVGAVMIGERPIAKTAGTVAKAAKYIPK
jgi:hypothetical protein